MLINMLDFNSETRINLADLLKIYFNIESYADTLPEAIDVVINKNIRE